MAHCPSLSQVVPQLPLARQVSPAVQRLRHLPFLHVLHASHFFLHFFLRFLPPLPRHRVARPTTRPG
jgi:hypothetical protein